MVQRQLMMTRRSSLLLTAALLNPVWIRDGILAQSIKVPAQSRTSQPVPGQIPDSRAQKQAVEMAAPATSQDAAEDRARQLVVMIRGKIGDQDTFGSGIIFGTLSNRIFIVTANHVVRSGPRNATSLEVQFNWLRYEWKTATLLEPNDSSLDLAVLNLEVTRQLALPRLDYAFLGSPESVRRNDDVHYMGFPNQRPWDSSPRPDPVSDVSSDSIRFRSAFIRPGHSGGPLLSRDRGLIGLIRADEDPEGVAVRIDRVVDRLREWGLPVLWTRAGTATPPTTQSRPPSSQDRVPATRRLALTSIRTAGQNSLALSNGEIYVWGDGRSGLPGRYFNGPVFDVMHIPNPTGRTESRPLRLYGGPGQHACILDQEGQLYCWGTNDYQQLGYPADKRQSSMRYQIRPTLRISDLRFQSLTLGVSHTCGLSSGTVFCWGDNSNGQLGDRVTSQTSSAPVPINLAEPVDYILSGGHFACAGSRATNAIYCWGGNYYGELGQTPGRPAYSRIPVQLPVAEFNLRTLSLGHTSGCILDSSGYPSCWGALTGSHIPRAIRGSPPLVGLTVGRLHACGGTKDGEAWCWGDNSMGQLGSPGVSLKPPQAFQVTGGILFRYLRAGHDHTCGISRSAEVYCWGDNRNGAVGPAAAAAIAYSPVLVKLPDAAAPAR